MRRLIDFLNHGIFPFVGRESELDTLYTFWNETLGAHNLRICLLLGEAGTGKSRVTEQLTLRIIEKSGLVVHVKLYQGTTTALAPLLSKAIAIAGSGNQLVRNEPEPVMPVITATLRRLSHLRPTLLVVEDIHLLDTETVTEFMSLLDGLADEPVSVLCIARPQELTVRGVIERYLVSEIELRGFTPNELRALWHALFDSAPDSDVIESIHRTTVGNGLAIRSVIRSLITNGILHQNSVSGTWDVTVDLHELEQRLQQNVDLLSSGMAAHLTPQEKEAAGNIAALGEMFAFETAQALLGDAHKTLEVLVFKGILVRLHSLTPSLNGIPVTSSIMAFSHTLLHLYFVEHWSVQPTILVDILHKNLPLYSILPYQIIGEQASTLRVSDIEAGVLIGTMLNAAETLDSTSDWKLGLKILHTAWQTFAAVKNVLKTEQRFETELCLLDCQLMLGRRDDNSEDFIAVAKRFIALAQGALPEHLLEYRITAFRVQYRLERRSQNPRFREIWDQVETLLNTHPALKQSIRYLQFLRAVGPTATQHKDMEMFPLLEQRVAEMLASGAFTDNNWVFLLKEVAPLILWSFHSPEQLQQRLDLMEQMESVASGYDITFQTRKMALYDGIGKSIPALKIAEHLIPRLHETGMRHDWIQVRLFRLYGYVALGYPTEQIEQELHRIESDTPPAILQRVRQSAGIRLFLQALLIGEFDWGARIFQTHVSDRLLVPTEELLFYGIISGEYQQIVLGLERTDLRPTTRAIIGLIEERVDEIVEAQLREMLAEPYVLRGHLIRNLILIEVITRQQANGSRKNNEAECFRTEIIDNLHNALQWLHTNEQNVYMQSVLERFGPQYLTKKELAEWNTKADQLGKQHAGILPSQHDAAMFRLSMFGSITLIKPDGSPVAIRGYRLKMVLGLMVAAEMVPSQLSYHEFCRLAANGENDQERARKMTSMALLRLRESTGDSIIDSDSDIPKLNCSRVYVDLVEAKQLLEDALHNARSNYLMRALPSLRQALKIIQGEVPFPTLYDEFFEAIRDDFDFLLRSSVIAVAQGLLQEKDHLNAEEILRSAFQAIPEDDELAIMLEETLRTLGKKTEAARIRQKIRDAAGDS